jgi:nucleotide-binding universal stress UspA family protein
MSKINRILIPTDFSETAQLAVAHGANMAKLFNAKIFLLHAVDTGIYMGGQFESVKYKEVTESVFQIADQKLKEVADEIIKKYKADLTPLTVTGKPAHAIVNAVKENAIDIIIMGTHGASGYNELFIGSNAHKVVNMAKCPVISIRATTKNVGFSHIIMPIGNDLLSRQKVNNVIELASKYNSTVHLLGLLESHDNIEDKKFEIKLETVENLLKKDNIKYTKKIIRAHYPANEAMKYSEEEGGDLIVIMTGHESDLPGVMLGMFAKQIVDHSKIPVMSIHPVETVIDTFDPAGGTGTM